MVSISFSKLRGQMGSFVSFRVAGEYNTCARKRGKEGQAAFSGGQTKSLLSPLQSYKRMQSSYFETLAKISFFQTEIRTIFASYHRTKGPQEEVFRDFVFVSLESSGESQVYAVQINPEASVRENLSCQD